MPRLITKKTKKISITRAASYLEVCLLCNMSTLHLIISFIVEHDTIGFQTYGDTIEKAIKSMSNHLKYKEITEFNYKTRVPEEDKIIWENIFISTSGLLPYALLYWWCTYTVLNRWFGKCRVFYKKIDEDSWKVKRKTYCPLKQRKISLNWLLYSYSKFSWPWTTRTAIQRRWENNGRGGYQTSSSVACQWREGTQRSRFHFWNCRENEELPKVRCLLDIVDTVLLFMGRLSSTVKKT